MKLKEIYKFLDEISPFELQEEWDNSGINIGISDDIKKIYVSLDIDDNVIEQIEPNSLLITHHPLIFKGIKNNLPLPAYDYTIFASHIFNVLDARKAISQTERQNYILKIRELAKMVAEKYTEMEK